MFPRWAAHLGQPQRNGAIKIQIRENGKTTKIESTPGGKIDVEITETQNGPANKKIEAKDLDELKKKDAEVARLYEQYSQPPGVRLGAALPAGSACELRPCRPLRMPRRRSG